MAESYEGLLRRRSWLLSSESGAALGEEKEVGASPGWLLAGETLGVDLLMCSGLMTCLTMIVNKMRLPWSAARLVLLLLLSCAHHYSSWKCGVRTGEFMIWSGRLQMTEDQQIGMCAFQRRWSRARQNQSITCCT